MELLTTTLYQAYALFYMMPEGMPPDPALPCGLLFSTLESTTGQHPAGEHLASSVCRQEAPPCWADSPIPCVSRERWGPGGRGEAEQLVQVPPGVRGGVPANPADPGPPHQPGIPQGHAAAVDCHVSVTPSPCTGLSQTPQGLFVKAAAQSKARITHKQNHLLPGCTFCWLLTRCSFSFTIKNPKAAQHSPNNQAVALRCSKPRRLTQGCTAIFVSSYFTLPQPPAKQTSRVA